MFSRTWKSPLAEILICVAVCVVFVQTASFDFINYDDPVYAYDNPQVNTGLSAENLRWALTATGKINLWHPVTWLSHQTDFTLFGKDWPGGHHMVNVGFHALASVLAFWFLRTLTGSGALALFAALVFAIHPQRAQSVAWISERKDVLSGAFGLAAMLFYLRSWTAEGRVAKAPYIASILFLLAALASKPIAVVVPAALALCVYLYPERFPHKDLRHRLLPLLPLFAFAAVAALATTMIQSSGGLGDLGQRFPLTRRLLQMPYGIAFYLKGFLFPGNLPVWIYPPSGAGILLKSFLLTLLPLSLSALVWRFGRANRSLLLGLGLAVLFWLPISGIIPVSFYYVADRYTYFPHIGAAFAIGAFGWQLLQRFKKTSWAPLLATVPILVLGALGFRQTAFWKNSETLFSHEMKVNPRSLLAPVQLGDVHLQAGRHEEARALFQTAAEIDPEAAIAHLNHGKALAGLGRREEALTALQLATEKRPPLAIAYRLLATVRVEAGEPQLAAEALRHGLEVFPRDLGMLTDLGTLLGFELGKVDEALASYERVLAIVPNDVQALQGAGVLLLQQEAGRQRGIEFLQRLLDLQPNRQEIRAAIAAAAGS